MADLSNNPRTGITRKQGILLGVLSAVLAAVLWFGQGGAETLETQAASKAESGPRAARNKQVLAESTTRKTSWPKVALDTMLLNNPFALPEELQISPPEEVPVEIEETAIAAAAETAKQKMDEEERLKVQGVMANLKSQKVTMILRTNKDATAIIGDRVVHEGDVIEGVKIVSILPTGVLIEPAQMD